MKNIIFILFILLIGCADERFVNKQIESEADELSATEELETAEFYIEEDGMLIGGTYIKKYGWDFTSIKTEKRYIGGKGRGEWICIQNKKKLLKEDIE